MPDSADEQEDDIINKFEEPSPARVPCTLQALTASQRRCRRSVQSTAASRYQGPFAGSHCHAGPPTRALSRHARRVGRFCTPPRRGCSSVPGGSRVEPDLTAAPDTRACASSTPRRRASARNTLPSKAVARGGGGVGRRWLNWAAASGGAAHREVVARVRTAALLARLS